MTWATCWDVGQLNRCRLLVFRVRREEFPLRPQVRRRAERGDGDSPLGLRVRRSEVFGLLQDVRPRQPVAADQAAAAGPSQPAQSGRREYVWRLRGAEEGTELIRHSFSAARPRLRHLFLGRDR